MQRLFHFSEDPAIAVFRPHVAPTSNESEPLVWALDEKHAPSYWFPRDCPRACCWAGDGPLTEAGAALLALGGARRLHAIEAVWLERFRACRLYAYEFDPAPFQPKIPEAGYMASMIGHRVLTMRNSIAASTCRTSKSPTGETVSGVTSQWAAQYS